MTMTGNAMLPGVIASPSSLTHSDFTLHGPASRLCRRAVNVRAVPACARLRETVVLLQPAQYRGH
jgi:hypothetical protein